LVSWTNVVITFSVKLVSVRASFASWMLGSKQEKLIAFSTLAFFQINPTRVLRTMEMRS
jgi:hypothetical protein